ncbi:MAG: hypothetical protein E7019_06100 [Alphaproteobacteria bacterium]|nr:hypothetical protein [Alphaproteobacteria bacterium]
MLKKIICLMLGLLFSMNVLAADERYTVEISVDVTDNSAAEAQKKAMNEANRAAIIAVAKKITTTEGINHLMNMTDDQLVNFIKEVAVAEEKSSAIRYMASLKIVLNESILKQYMEERNLPVMVSMGNNVMVVPIFREFTSDAPLLWENTNLWKQAWDEEPVSKAIRIFPVAASGINYAIIDANKAMAMDGEALDKLMRANNADDIYVLDATYNGIEGLIIKAMSYSGDSYTYRVEGPRSSGAELFAKAVKEVKADMENRISQKNISEASIEKVLVALYPYSQLSDWVKLENDLQAINVVNKVEIQAQGNGKVQFKLAYVGSLDKLIQALKDKSYRLIDHGKYYSVEKY